MKVKINIRETFVHTKHQFDAPMYDNRSNCIGLRVKGIGQLLSFGGKLCTSSKEDLKKLGEAMRDNLNKGEMDVQAAKAYAAGQVAWLS